MGAIFQADNLREITFFVEPSLNCMFLGGFSLEMLHEIHLHKLISQKDSKEP